VLQLKVNQAPVAVQYFLKLVEAGYFNNTTLFYRSPDIIANDGSISEFEQTREVVIPCEPYFGTVSEGCVSLVPNTEMNVFSNKWFATLSPDVVSSFRSSVFASVVDGIDNLHAIQDGDMVISAEKL
ncbi:MAG: peptidylprolyl isomerase, partial [Bacteroidales bacterium]|nr:peptidylprolyl isomerase [Bacteroidales bacterium]